MKSNPSKRIERAIGVIAIIMGILLPFITIPKDGIVLWILPPVVMILLGIKHVYE